MENKEKVIHVGTTEHICFVCGAPIPEGIEVCPMCWDMYFNNNN